MSESAVAAMWQDFVCLFFPSECLACSLSRVKGEELVCTNCLRELPRCNYHLYHDNALWRRLSYRIPLADAVALFRFTKSSRVQRLLHALKYKNHPELGVALGRHYASVLESTHFFQNIDLIIPVPLHPVRLRSRGYNQSVQFAAGLSETSGIPFSDEMMVRSQRTETQTAKSKLNRWESMRGVFTVAEFARLSGKRVLLVDDVVTTGATVESCVTALLAAGVGRVSIACIAEA